MIVMLAAYLEAMLNCDILKYVAHAAAGTNIINSGAFTFGRDIGFTSFGRRREGIESVELSGSKKPMEKRAAGILLLTRKSLPNPF